MLALAQYWNLLAGYAGLVSVGQQAFVGFGAYVLFALAILAGLDPLAAILLAGLAGGARSPSRPAVLVFRLQGAYFAIGTWVIAEVFRLRCAQWKMLGGGTGTSLPPGDARMPALEWSAAVERKPPARGDIADLLAGAAARRRHDRPRLPPAALAQGLALAAIRDNETRPRSVGVDPRRMKTRGLFWSPASPASPAR